jgi:hypothetical protein
VHDGIGSLPTDIQEFARFPPQKAYRWENGLCGYVAESTAQKTAKEPETIGPDPGVDSGNVIQSKIEMSRYTQSFDSKRFQTIDVVRADAAKPIALVRRWAGTWWDSSKDRSTTQITKNLNQAVVRSHLKQDFLPDSQIEKLVTAHEVEAELNKANYSIVKLSRISKPPVRAENSEKYKKILTILYFMKQPSKIRRFVKYGVDDSHLPFDSTRSGAVFGVRRRGDPKATFIKFNKRVDAEEFVDRQWGVLSPVFMATNGTEVPHCNLEADVILPFRVKTSLAREGASGQVFKVQINHENHALNTAGVSSSLSWHSYVVLQC